MSSATSKLKMSIIIPSWTGEVSRPMRSLGQQTFRDYAPRGGPMSCMPIGSPLALKPTGMLMHGSPANVA